MSIISCLTIFSKYQDFPPCPSPHSLSQTGPGAGDLKIFDVFLTGVCHYFQVTRLKMKSQEVSPSLEQSLETVSYLVHCLSLPRVPGGSVRVAGGQTGSSRKFGCHSAVRKWGNKSDITAVSHFRSRELESEEEGGQNGEHQQPAVHRGQCRLHQSAPERHLPPERFHGDFLHLPRPWGSPVVHYFIGQSSYLSVITK